jgi:hypothetical protein
MGGGGSSEAAQLRCSALEYSLAEREEELKTTTEGLNNLQDVLEDFQVAREMERQTDSSNASP